ncbi:MAG: sigma 54-interacting transcriptional regulator [Candidatus Aminicenantes bacterium]|nr:sigma 54-interacting transcriptional regulator [Candidatus Aminicenantes bacterium]
MLYLLYLRSGFIKKFPLTKKTIIIGRSSKNDLSINESFISQKHAKINVFKKHIIVEDLGSTNGIFIETTKIHKAKIEINQYFRIGYLNIFLKEGNVQDFVISKKVQPVLNRISKMFTVKGDKTQEAIKLLYSEPLIEMLQIGFKLEEFVDIFRFAKKVFDRALGKGSLILITRENNNNIIESKWNYKKEYYPLILEILQLENIFQKTRINEKILDAFYFCSFPFISSVRCMLFIYLLETEESIPQKTIKFLKDLSVEISIIDSLIEQNKKIIQKEKAEIPEIITNNPIMLNFLSKCKRIANSDLFVIIEGETGTGKELVAKFIHFNSKRNSGNFVALNCAAIPENLMENELFGHEKGAFTDAKNQRKGKLDLSSGGTFVLDEIGNMPLSLQKKLLRAIQEEQFYRIGGNLPIKVDLRIICLTHTNILELLKKEIFREDLYYRLNHVTLKILPLRERKEDIAPLINHFVKIFSKENQITIKGFSKEAIKAMEMYDWPGNVRELQNEIKKIISLSDDDDIIDLSRLKDEIIHFYNQRKKPSEKFNETEKEIMLNLLKKHRWNKTLVSREMKISRTALYQKLNKFNIK